MAERLDALILETQNVGLIVDLLVALQIHATALAALGGDAAYAQAEVDPLADLLETMLGDNLPGSQGYRHASPPFWWEPALALGQYNPATFGGYEPEVAPAAVAVAQTQAQGRIKGLAYPLWFQVTDPDPANNRAVMIFNTAPPLLPPGVMNILNQVLGGSTPLEFVWEVLTGESENWWAIGGNIVLSFVPIAGEIMDFIAIFTDPTIWGKAMSLIGLVASILSDITEILAAVGVVAPPALLAIGPAVATEAVDIGAAVLRHVRKLVSADVFAVIKNIPFQKALQLGADVLGHLAKRAANSVSSWPSGDIGAIFGIIQNVLHSVWDPFVALLKHYGTAGLGKLFTLGFGDGAFLAGRVLKQGGELSDEAIEILVKIGDDLAQGGVELSDEAVGGLGKLANSLPEGHVQGIVKNLCPGGLAQINDHRVRGLASPLPQTVCHVNFQKILENVVNLDEAGLNGFKRLATNGISDATLAKVMSTYANNPQLLNEGFGILNRTQFDRWSGQTVERMFDFMNKNNSQYVEAFLNRVSTNIDRVNFDQQIYRMLGRLDQDTVLKQMFDPTTSDEIANGVARLLRKAEHPSTWPAGRYGNNFQLERAKEYFGSGRLKAVEFEEELEDGAQNAYDLILDSVNKGAAIEVKYWRRQTVVNKVNDLAGQLRRYVNSGRKVVVEFGETATDPVTKSSIAQLRERLAGLGVRVDQIEFILIPR